jgi:hypothetical protein
MYIRLSSLKPRFKNYSSDAEIGTFNCTWNPFDDKNNAGTLTATEEEHLGDVFSDIKQPTTSCLNSGSECIMRTKINQQKCL